MQVSTLTSCADQSSWCTEKQREYRKSNGAIYTSLDLPSFAFPVSVVDTTYE